MDENEDESIILEKKISGNQIIPIAEKVNIAQSTVKIKLSDGFGSGIFLKIKKENNKTFFGLMTCAHVIGNNNVQDKEEILIIYNNEKDERTLKLDKNERYINCFQTKLGLDISIIEIIEKDGIQENYFSLPYTGGNTELVNTEITVIQYPKGEKLSLSEGKITGMIGKNGFYHSASTEGGSSGAPIILKDFTVLGLHRGASVKNKNKDIKNVGVSIGSIIEEIKTYKREGKGFEFYKDGKIKYEGDFKDDEYHGHGKYYDYKENGDIEIYEGDFSNGKKDGDFAVYDKNDKKIRIARYEKDECKQEEIIQVESSQPSNSGNNINLNKGDINKIGNLLLSYLNDINKETELCDFICTNCNCSTNDHELIRDNIWRCNKCLKECDNTLI